jgi:transposase InsO family protein
VEQHKKEHGLNRCLEALDLPKSTYYYRKNRPDEPSKEEQELMNHVRAIIQEHPGYGYRRILPELEERTGQTVNHKRLRRLLNEHKLGLPRQVAKHSPSPVQEILGDAAGPLNLVADLNPGPLEVFSTDFTEVSYAGGSRTAHLMAVVDLESKYVPGWAVGPSANRKLAMRCWKQVRERLTSMGEELDGKIIHHDLDSVYTSCRDRFSSGYERGSWRMGSASATRNAERKGIRGSSRSGAGQRPRSDHGLQKPRRYPHCEPFLTSGSGIMTIRYYNRERRHSSIGYVPPRDHLKDHLEEHLEEHLGQTLDNLDPEPQTAAAS